MPPSVLGTVSDLGQFIDNLPCDIFIVDDYFHWKNNRRAKEQGKPIFPSSRSGHIVVAFDDNACMHLPGPHSPLPAAAPSTTVAASASGAAGGIASNLTNAAAAAASTPSSPSAASSSAHFVRVRPLLALIHPDYFERHMDQVLMQHMQQQQQQQHK